jgi:SAM-dependent methyltransferase
MNKSDLLKTAHARLYPSLTNPNYLVLRARRSIFTEWIRDIEPGSRVLDVGGRYQPYRPLLEQKACQYVAVDVQKTELVDVVANGEALPFRDGSFDLIIATGVFEYFHEPHQAAQRMHQILTPGGTLLLSVAAVAPRFVDEECWRYMPRGLKQVLSPFGDVTIRPEVSSIGGLCRFMNLGFHDFLKVRPLKAAYALTACPVMNLIGLGFERARLTTNDQWTGNYSVRAIK